MSNISNEEIEDQIRILEETAVPGESDAFALRALRELLAYRKASEQPVGWMTDVELDELHRGIADEAYIYRHADAASTIPLYTATPAPVVPDGYVLVSKEPTAEMISSGIAAHYERTKIQIHDRPAHGPMECAYVAMLAAAPQPEVK